MEDTPEYTPVAIDELDNHKKKVVAALITTKGVVTSACELAGIHRSTYYNWIRDFPLFRQMAEEAQEVAIDFVEGKLFSNIEDGDTASIIFFLKTRGKKRGYVERTELTGKDGERLNPTSEDVNKLIDELLHKISTAERPSIAP